MRLFYRISTAFYTFAWTIPSTKKVADGVIDLGLHRKACSNRQWAVPDAALFFLCRCLLREPLSMVNGCWSGATRCAAVISLKPAAKVEVHTAFGKRPRPAVFPNLAGE